MTAVGSYFPRFDNALFVQQGARSPRGFGDPEIRQEMLAISAGFYLPSAVTKVRGGNPPKSSRFSTASAHLLESGQRQHDTLSRIEGWVSELQLLFTHVVPTVLNPRLSYYNTQLQADIGICQITRPKVLA
jgi:hypothetical protein